MNTKGKRAVILVEKKYEDLELWYPYFRLKEANMEVHLVGPEGRTTYLSKHGYEAKSHKGISEVHASDVDLLIIPGGGAPDFLRTNAQIVKLVKDVLDQGKPVAAICHAGSLLASANVLKGKRATSYISIRDDMMHAGAHWIDEAVVRDGNLITSRKPDDLPVFLQAILEAAGHKTNAQ